MSMNVIRSPYPASGGGGVPSFFSDVWFWGDVPQEIGFSDEDRMDQFTDLSGNGNHGFATGTDRPWYDTNQIDGLPMARFAGAQRFAFPSMASLTQGHFFILLKMLNDQSGTAGSNNGPWGMCASAADDVYFAYDGDNKIYDGWGSTTRKDAISKGSANLTDPHAYEVQSVSGLWKNYLDGTQLHTTATNTVGWRTDPIIGATGVRSCSMWVAEMVICSSIQDSAARGEWRDYVNDKYPSIVIV